MGTEIERKFLVIGDEWKQAEPVYFCQGYLSLDKQRTVRVRIAGDAGALTIKGVTAGATRAEFEYAIPRADAEELIQMCVGPLIEKYRRTIRQGQLLWEVDEFLGDNRGLVVAEVELESENQTFDLPAWVSREVTDDPRYYNSNLSVMPYQRWPTDLR